MTARHVAPLRAVALTFRTIIRQLVTRGRAIGLTVITAAVVLIVALVGRSSTGGGERALEVVAHMGLTIVVPLVTLVFAAASLGDPREDGTLVYLWLRPMDRWPVVVGAYLAALVATLPFTIVPLGLAAGLGGGGASGVAGAIAASATGVVAYAAVFLLLGLLVRNAVVWGLGYILVWEGLVASFGPAAERLAIRGYTITILERIGDVELGAAAWSLPGAVTTLVAAGVVALGIASIRLRHLDVA